MDVNSAPPIDQAFMFTLRTIVCTPVHILFSVSMGLAFFRVQTGQASWAILVGWWLFASAMHGAYDLMSPFRERAAGIPLVIVAIDDVSLEGIGDWPWPRAYIADLVNMLSKSGAHALGAAEQA